MGRTYEALKRAEREKSKETAKENGNATGGENGFQQTGTISRLMDIMLRRCL